MSSSVDFSSLCVKTNRDLETGSEKGKGKGKREKGKGKGKREREREKRNKQTLCAFTSAPFSRRSLSTSEFPCT